MRGNPLHSGHYETLLGAYGLCRHVACYMCLYKHSKQAPVSCYTFALPARSLSYTLHVPRRHTLAPSCPGAC